MIPTSDRKIKDTFEIAFCLSYNILESQRKQSENKGDIARERQECRIHF